MHNIKELVKELCPNGVEYKELNTLVDYIQPTKYIVKSTKYNDEYDIPVLTPGQTFILGYTNEKEGIYNADKENPIILFDDFTTAFRWINFKFKIKSSAVKILIPRNNNINFRYVFYAMQTIKFDNTQHNRQWISKYSILKIPVPPIEVQNEIVRILDNFTELEAELEAELEVRKNQYEYYRDKMLKFSDNVKMVKFGNVAQIQRGASPRPISKFITDDENAVNWIKIGDVKSGMKYITDSNEKITMEGAKKSRFVKKGDFILSNSMSFGRPYILKINGCIHDGWLSISDFKDYFVPDFLYYLLSSSKIQNEFKKKASFGGAVQNLNADIVKAIEIPMPSIEEQKRIVSILDRFDKLCNDISDGLPAEIEARRKQYEYYRDKLLSFKQ